MADTAIVGLYLGAASLAGVGASSSVQFLVLGFCNGTGYGVTIPIAQAFGAGDFPTMRRRIYVGLISLMSLSVVIAAACALACPWILRLLATPDDIFDEAYSYLVVIFLGIPFTMLYNALSGIMRAAGDSRTPFCFLLIAVTLNIALDLLFIIAFGMGVFGAALATVLSQGISGFLCAFFIIFKLRVLVPQRTDRIWSWPSCRCLLGMGVPMGLQFSIKAIGSMVMQAANNSLGSMYSASFAAATKIKQLAISPFEALGSAVSTFASQNYGAHDIGRIRKGIAQGTCVTGLLGVILSVLLAVFGRSMCLMFVSRGEEDILNAAGRFLRLGGGFYWTMAVLQVFRQTLQGLGFTKRAVFSGVVEMIVRIALSSALVPRLGYTAVCIMDPAAWGAAALYLTPTLFWSLRSASRRLSQGSATRARDM